MVDGNVHFAGTQGVGKSTVLRALLFFYNADIYKYNYLLTKDSKSRTHIKRLLTIM